MRRASRQIEMYLPYPFDGFFFYHFCNFNINLRIFLAVPFHFCYLLNPVGWAARLIELKLNVSHDLQILKRWEISKLLENWNFPK